MVDFMVNFQAILGAILSFFELRRVGLEDFSNLESLLISV